MTHSCSCIIVLTPFDTKHPSWIWSLQQQGEILAPQQMSIEHTRHFCEDDKMFRELHGMKR